MRKVEPSKLALAGAAALFLAAAACNGAIAQSPQAVPVAKPSQFKNLQVLPAEIPRDRLIAVMETFSMSLGVKCTFCHVAKEGKPGSMDFASDANKHKDIARLMMRMTRRINEQDLGVKDFRESKVTCYTCHRASAHPRTAAPAAPPAPPPAQPTG
jgi:hypothetical protein